MTSGITWPSCWEAETIWDVWSVFDHGSNRLQAKLYMSFLLQSCLHQFVNCKILSGQQRRKDTMETLEVFVGMFEPWKTQTVVARRFHVELWFCRPVVTFRIPRDGSNKKGWDVILGDFKLLTLIFDGQQKCSTTWYNEGSSIMFVGHYFHIIEQSISGGTINWYVRDSMQVQAEKFLWTSEVHGHLGFCHLRQLLQRLAERWDCKDVIN